MIDLNSNKEVLKYCPNFYNIINFNPINGDELTSKIIYLYREYIFKIDVNNIEEIEEVIKLDEAVMKYINDYLFRNEVQNKIVKVKVHRDCKDILKYFIDEIVKIFNGYDEYTTKIMTFSRWI